MVQRRQMEQVRIREERVRKQAYHDALDVKVFEEELDASRRRKGGANPAVCVLAEGAPLSTLEADTAQATATATTTTTATPPTYCGICVTDFRFSTNMHPLRFSASGKHHFMPIFQGTAADSAVKPMRCKKNHSLAAYKNYWMDCEGCHERGIAWACWPCYLFFCSKCYEGDRRGKVRI
ncbi:hypothetical protein B484DRAFT_261724 [Ochromonadaceae sp. CCMP2298]|nr:hypothetical protein B484DRAFT_261724 [Ochromonadaceae sp. CCMP2298]